MAGLAGWKIKWKAVDVYVCTIIVYTLHWLQTLKFKSRKYKNILFIALLVKPQICTCFDGREGYNSCLWNNLSPQNLYSWHLLSKCLFLFRLCLLLPTKTNKMRTTMTKMKMTKNTGFLRRKMQLCTLWIPCYHLLDPNPFFPWCSSHI